MLKLPNNQNILLKLICEDYILYITIYLDKSNDERNFVTCDYKKNLPSQNRPKNSTEHVVSQPGTDSDGNRVLKQLFIYNYMKKINTNENPNYSYCTGGYQLCTTTDQSSLEINNIILWT